MEFFKEKKNRYLCIFLLGVALIIATLVSAIGHFNDYISRVYYPEEVLLSDEIREMPASTQKSGMNYSCLLTQAGMSVSMPDNTVLRGEYAKGTYGDVVCISMAAEMDKGVFERTLPSKVAMSVVGEKPQVSYVESREGYLGDKKASFYAATVRIQTGLKEETYYTMCYMVEGKSRLYGTYLYVACKKEDLLEEAYGVLTYMAESIVQVEDMKGWIEQSADAGVEQPEKMGESILLQTDIDLGSYGVPVDENGYFVSSTEGMDVFEEYKSENYLTDGVVFLQWMNVKTQPDSWHFLKKGGTVCPKVEEYSYAGGILFHLGSVKEGDSFLMYLHTDNTLEGVTVEFMEYAQFLDIYYPEPVPRGEN